MNGNGTFVSGSYISKREQKENNKNNVKSKWRKLDDVKIPPFLQPRTPEHQIFSPNAIDNPGENISELFTSYRSKVLPIAQGVGLSIATDYREVLSLSHILLLQAGDFSDLQIQEFSENTLEQL
ncbi:10765_t:CDS:2 [Funneliformis mosseae]|uniref:10765_t:CDS:1 n=1 Tax=Funneliformis mosseae TaxID=27381 RepID=A0A9N9I269_FUNMO|nr:10765_t:CDS:2 [Funneliformis mosseae]